MSHIYRPVGWDRSKIVYDLALAAAAGLFIYVFIRVAPSYGTFERPVDTAITRMRAFGLCAFLMLSVILCIGPLARLDRRFLPLLYNRRHFGVLTAMVALGHVIFVADWYFAFSPTPKWEALLSSNTSYGQALGFPFELFGLAAFAILAVLALTSHDFWMSFLTPSVWKALHMSIYAAYALVVAHIAFGYLQDVDSLVVPGIVVGAAALVAGLHLAAAAKERRLDRGAVSADVSAEGGWIPVGRWDEIENKRARIIVAPGGERIAVFRYDGKFSAISNVCAHQQGPLGEGRIIDGCVTCPWHGFQFDPETGCAPPPFADRIPTYRLKREGSKLFVHETALAPGTRVPAIDIPEAAI